VSTRSRPRARRQLVVLAVAGLSLLVAVAACERYGDELVPNGDLVAGTTTPDCWQLASWGEHTTEALVRVANALHARGYGLLIHDGYRPWYVTKMFWDATPPAQHEFVANPADGSRHNRGEAVDLSLYDLSTGRPVEMPGTYDEFSHRSYPGYEGGTSLQRWHRELLRSAMEAEGFTVFTSEWWHFDYKDWKRYHIGNITFEKIR